MTYSAINRFGWVQFWPLDGSPVRVLFSPLLARSCFELLNPYSRLAFATFLSLSLSLTQLRLSRRDYLLLMVKPKNEEEKSSSSSPRRPCFLGKLELQLLDFASTTIILITTTKTHILDKTSTWTDSPNRNQYQLLYSVLKSIFHFLHSVWTPSWFHVRVWSPLCLTVLSFLTSNLFLLPFQVYSKQLTAWSKEPLTT